MDKKTQQILLFAGIGVVGYMIWKRSQGTSEFSNAGGWGRYRRLKKAEDRFYRGCCKACTVGCSGECGCP